MEAAIGTLNIADVFLLNWPELGIERVPMRVKQVVLPKDDKTNVLVKCTEDTFDAPPITAPLGEPDELDTEPSDPVPITKQLFTEAPYYFVDDKLSVYTSQKGRILSTASRGDPVNVRWKVVYSDTTSSDFTEDSPASDPAEFDATAVLASGPVRTGGGPITQSVETFDLTIRPGSFEGTATTARFLFINDEIMYITSATPSVDATTTTVTVKRAILDTVPENHHCLLYTSPSPRD